MRALTGAVDDYLRELETRFELSLAGRRVLLDCANGATYRRRRCCSSGWAPRSNASRASPTASTSTRAAAPRTRSWRSSACARATTTSASRSTATATACSRSRATARSSTATRSSPRSAATSKRRGELKGDGVAVTVMTNFGFHQAMDEAGIEVATTDVGDRHVVEELFRRDWVLGGEQSGHIVDMRLTPSGDGIAAALLLLRALGDEPLEAGAAMRKLPQMLQNVRVEDRDALATAAGVWEAVESESHALEGEGRILVRPSGTEPVVRVMVEAPSQDRCEAVCARLVEVVPARARRARLTFPRHCQPSTLRQGSGLRSGITGRTNVQLAEFPATGSRLQWYSLYLFRSRAKEPQTAALFQLEESTTRSRKRRRCFMCGIVGYVGERSCRELLMHGLERLEYRGYDSAGLSLISDGRHRVGARGRQPQPAARGGRRERVERRRRGRAQISEADDRHRPHALGHARQALRAQRAPAPRLQRTACTSSSTASSRTTSSCASSSRPTDTTSLPRPTPRRSRT